MIIIVKLKKEKMTKKQLDKLEKLLNKPFPKESGIQLLVVKEMSYWNGTEESYKIIMTKFGKIVDGFYLSIANIENLI